MVKSSRRNLQATVNTRPATESTGIDIRLLLIQRIKPPPDNLVVDGDEKFHHSCTLKIRREPEYRYWSTKLDSVGRFDQDIYENQLTVFPREYHRFNCLYEDKVIEVPINKVSQIPEPKNQIHVESLMESCLESVTLPEATVAVKRLFTVCAVFKETVARVPDLSKLIAFWNHYITATEDRYTEQSSSKITLKTYCERHLGYYGQKRYFHIEAWIVFLVHCWRQSAQTLSETSAAVPADEPASQRSSPASIIENISEPVSDPVHRIQEDIEGVLSKVPADEPLYQNSTPTSETENKAEPISTTIPHVPVDIEEVVSADLTTEPQTSQSSEISASVPPIETFSLTARIKNIPQPVHESEPPTVEVIEEVLSVGFSVEPSNQNSPPASQIKNILEPVHDFVPPTLDDAERVRSVGSAVEPSSQNSPPASQIKNILEPVHDFVPPTLDDVEGVHSMGPAAESSSQNSTPMPKIENIQKLVYDSVPPTPENNDETLSSPLAKTELSSSSFRILKDGSWCTKVSDACSGEYLIDMKVYRRADVLKVNDPESLQKVECNRVTLWCGEKDDCYSSAMEFQKRAINRIRTDLRLSEQPVREDGQTSPSTPALAERSATNVDSTHITEWNNSVQVQSPRKPKNTNRRAPKRKSGQKTATPGQADPDYRGPCTRSRRRIKQS